MTTHFLQSKEWEGFQKSLGREVFRVDGVLVIRLSSVFGRSYLYSAGGSGIKIPADFLKNDIFFKFEPMLSTGTAPVGFRKSDKEVQPQKTIILDLSKTEDELLKGMHPKTRYNIRVAEKNGVEIRNHKTQTLTEFWRILEKTAQRDKFGTHLREYYEKLFELPIAQLFTAEYQDKVIAVNIILFYGDTAYYLHGASDYEYRNRMAPYLLHWEIIRYAKENSFSEYDFWGIDEKKWPGVTRFKKGFGGKEVEYIGSYDYVFQKKWYGAYKLRQYLRNI